MACFGRKRGIAGLDTRPLNVTNAVTVHKFLVGYGVPVVHVPIVLI